MDRRSLLAGGAMTSLGALAARAVGPAQPPAVLAAPIGDVYDVTKAPFNANPNDDTDDEPAITAAITAAAAAGGGTVFFPATTGAYVIGKQITLMSNVALAGGPQGAKIRLSAGFAAANVFYLQTQKNVLFENLSIDCLNKKLEFVVYMLTNCERITLRNLAIANIEHTSPSAGVRVTASRLVSIENCRFENMRTGVEIRAKSSNVTVSRCEFRKISHIGTWVAGGADAADFTTQITVERSLFEEFDRKGVNDRTNAGHAIHWTGAGKAFHRHALIRGNTVLGIDKNFVGDGGTADLIAPYDVDGVVIDGNIVSRGGDNGISLDRNRNVVISNNVVHNCFTAGINVWDADDTTVTGNVVYDNSKAGGEVRGGIRVYANDTGTVSSNIVIAGNRAYDSRAAAQKTQDFGIFINAQSRSVTIGANDLEGNKQGMIKSVATDNIVYSFTLMGAAKPTAGYWEKGMIMRNSEWATGANLHWVCTASGAPGTWLPV